MGGTRRVLSFLVALLAVTTVAVPAGAAVVAVGSDAIGVAAAATQFLSAEGTTRAGSQEYLTILNPGDAEVSAAFTWDLVAVATGERTRRVDRMKLPPGRTTV